MIVVAIDGTQWSLRHRRRGATAVAPAAPTAAPAAATATGGSSAVLEAGIGNSLSSPLGVPQWRDRWASARRPPSNQVQAQVLAVARRIRAGQVAGSAQGWLTGIQHLVVACLRAIATFAG